MQTFLPLPSYVSSARSLDNKRLGKQRVEAYQIMKAIIDPTYGWQNHPAVNMWRPYLPQLFIYGTCVCLVWRSKGFNDMMLDKIIDLQKTIYDYDNKPFCDLDVPHFLYDKNFHLSHQSNLIRKDPEFYKPLFPNCPEGLEYIWPVKEAVV